MENSEPVRTQLRIDVKCPYCNKEMTLMPPLIDIVMMAQVDEDIAIVPIEFPCALCNEPIRVIVL